MEAPREAGRWLPGLQTIRTYHRSWLPRDVVAGIVLTALLVPAGMGYAQASGRLVVRVAQSSLPGGADFAGDAMLWIGSLWFVAVVTAACASFKAAAPFVVSR